MDTARDRYREHFKRHVDTNARIFADDLAMLLSRAQRQYLTVNPDTTDDEGTCYIVEWVFDGEHHSLIVEHDPALGWKVSGE